MSTETSSRGPERRRRRPGGGRGGGSRSSAPAVSPSNSRESAPFDPAPVPFPSLVTDPDLLDALDQRGYEKTTPIQSAVLPYALQGKDVIGCAETGTGKTAAYLLPILARLLKENREGYKPQHGVTRALVLAPTRELATQIDDEVQGFAYHSPMSSVAVYGGVAMEPQSRALAAGVDIVIATPGRLLDHMRNGKGDFSKLEVFVLDEADRMMDMGFWPDVRRIAEALPPSSERQTMLFSATMPDEVMRFADTLAPDAVFVQVGSRRGPASTISHEAQILPGREKASFLARYLRRVHEPTIVFVNTKIGCDRLARQLSQSGLRVAAIHADRSQRERTDVIEAFRAGRIRTIVATDVAARGLDIDSVGLVVNFEVPRGLDSYVHRVGRTGRNETTGHALTLADPSEQDGLHDIEQAFGLTLVGEQAAAPREEQAGGAEPAQDDRPRRRRRRRKPAPSSSGEGATTESPAAAVDDAIDTTS